MYVYIEIILNESNFYTVTLIVRDMIEICSKQIIFDFVIIKSDNMFKKVLR